METTATPLRLKLRLSTSSVNVNSGDGSDFVELSSPYQNSNGKGKVKRESPSTPGHSIGSSSKAIDFTDDSMDSIMEEEADGEEEEDDEDDDEDGKDGLLDEDSIMDDIDEDDQSGDESSQDSKLLKKQIAHGGKRGGKNLSISFRNTSNVAKTEGDAAGNVYSIKREVKDEDGGDKKRASSNILSRSSGGKIRTTSKKESMETWTAGPKQESDVGTPIKEPTTPTNKMPRIKLSFNTPGSSSLSSSTHSSSPAANVQKSAPPPRPEGPLPQYLTSFVEGAPLPAEKKMELPEFPLPPIRQRVVAPSGDAIGMRVCCNF